MPVPSNSKGDRGLAVATQGPHSSPGKSADQVLGGEQVDVEAVDLGELLDLARSRQRARDADGRAVGEHSAQGDEAPEVGAGRRGGGPHVAAACQQYTGGVCGPSATSQPRSVRGAPAASVMSPRHGRIRGCWITAA